MSFDHRPQMQKYKQSYWIHKDFHLSPVIRVYRKSQPVTFHLISRCLFFTRTPSSSLNVCGFQNSVWAHTGAAGRSSSGVCGSVFIEIIIIQVMHPHKPSRWQQCGISNFNALINMYVVWEGIGCDEIWKRFERIFLALQILQYSSIQIFILPSDPKCLRPLKLFLFCLCVCVCVCMCMCIHNYIYIYIYIYIFI